MRTPSPPLVRLALGTLLLGVALVGPASPLQTGIDWRSVDSAYPERAAAAPARAAEVFPSALLRQAAVRHVVVRFARPLDAHRRRLLREAGLEVQGSLGRGAAFARLDRTRLDVGRLLASGSIAGVESVRAEWKLHPALADGAVPDHVRTGRGRDGAERVGLALLFFPDVDPERQALIVTASGGRVLDPLVTVNGLVVVVPERALSALATLDEVQWIEPLPPRLGEASVATTVGAAAPNDSARVVTQVDLVRAAPYGLDGSGVTALVYDRGTARATHVDFGGRLAARDFSGTIDHATHVAATLGGDGGASAGLYEGMAPGVSLESYGFEDDGSGVSLFSNPGDLEADFGEASGLFGATLASGSVVSDVEAGGYSCAFQGDYGVTGSALDAIVRGSLGTPLIVLWAAGNERRSDRCDVEGFGDYYSLAPPSTAKNPIVVGAVRSNDESMTNFSSWGPTDDGRLKPDLCAPGCQSDDDLGVTSAVATSDMAYGVACGTSTAAPTTAGAVALLLEDYRASQGGPDPTGATLKALLVHTAEDLGPAGPDFAFGYGSLRIRDAIELLRSGHVREDVVGAGETVAFEVTVAPGASELEITLAWDDAPGTPNVLGSLVNDLDLRVFDPGGARRHPWTLDPAVPSAPAVQAVEDHLNNVEQVHVDAPVPGVWRVEVHGFDVPQGPQDFSLCASDALVLGPDVRILLDAPPPTALAPGVAVPVTVEVLAQNDVVVPGSPTLHFRYAAGGFASLALTPLGDDRYAGELPPAVCGATPEYFFSAVGAVAGTVTLPEGAPASTFQAVVETSVPVFADDFEADLGWSVTNDASLTGGAWERGVPAGGGARLDPPNDFDGSGACWLTENVAGNSDLDGGPTVLTSPSIDLASAADATVTYAKWFQNDDQDSDALTVEVSDDDGASWVTLEVVPDMSGWSTSSFRLLDHVALTDRVVFRFSAADSPNNSISEAALDGFAVVDSICDAVLLDCNGNGVVDADDVASGRSADLDGNGVPDECDPDCNGDGMPDAVEPDCDGDGLPDECAIDQGAPDCDGNAVPDSCDIAAGAPDCDGNSVPDECDPDCDGDGTPDACEADCDGDGIPDVCAILMGAPDCDGNGVPDRCDLAGGAPDCNGNAVLDVCEPDCDVDGTPDACEPDCDGDGVVDDCDVEPDCDGNGTPDGCDIAGGAPDCNGDEVLDACQLDGNDCDANGVPDDCQADCDGDGVPDGCDVEPDCDGNGTQDNCDVAGGAPDCDGNGVPDVCQADCDDDGAPDACEPDCDGDGRPDDCEGNPDCNGNGIPDDCDITAGAPDCNGNGVPDSCEAFIVNYCTSLPNSTGAAATISSVGSNSLAANDLTLVASGLPDNSGIFITSPDQAQVPLGNGIVCLGSSTLGFVRRLFPSYVAMNNTATLLLDHTDAPLPELFPTVGSTWHYQAWFRDFVGAGFNFSDALSVTYCP